MDPLSALREFSIAKQINLVTVEGDRVKFGEKYSFPKTSATGYKKHGGGVYDLHTLVYLLKQPTNVPWINYVKTARETGIPQVSFPDRKELIDYLTGVVDASDKIQLTAPELVLPLAVDEDDVDPSSKRARLEALDTSAMDLDTTSAPVIGKERLLRDRNSQLSLPAKSFKDVLELLRVAQVEQAKWKSAAAAKPHHPRRKKVIPVIPSGRFDRPVEQNPKSTFKIANTQGAPPLPPGPPPPPPPSAAPPLTASRPPSQPRPSSKHQAHSRSQHKSGSSSGQGQKMGRPIIIVPAAPSAKITMLNVKEFLEKGTYKPNDVCKREGVKKESQLIFQRKYGRPRPVPYEVTDRAPEKSSSTWRRVVAVFVTGASWQFKDWPFPGSEKGDMALTFAAVLGLHVSMKNEEQSDSIKSWNVKRFKLHPVDRHGDQSVVTEIYNAIDNFMANSHKYASQVAY